MHGSEGERRRAAEFIPPQCHFHKRSGADLFLFSGVFAGVHFLLPHTRLTLHVAAPADLAVAGEAGEPHGRVVASPAAHALTAGVLGAGAAPRTRGVARGSAEAGGVLQVDQVGGSEALAVSTRARQLRLPRGGVGDAQHSHGGVVAVLQQPARVVERRQLLPAGSDGAGAGDAVTLAGRFQGALYGLWRKQRERRQILEVNHLNLQVYQDQRRQFPLDPGGGLGQSRGGFMGGPQGPRPIIIIFKC